MTTDVLPDTWTQWIHANLMAQCSRESMLSAMVKGGFSIADAVHHLDTARAGLATAAAVPPVGQFVPPGSTVPVGSVIDIEGHLVQVMLRMKKPLITVFDHVLTAAECTELMERSTAKLKRSTTVDPNSAARIVIKDRTSDGTFWNKGHDDFISRLDRRMMLLTQHPVAHFEGLQVMRYLPGGEYKAHFDYFPLEQKGAAAHMTRGGQRVATLLMYLQAPEEGGDTEFPEAGVSVVPKQGSAVYFEYMDRDGRYDPLTLHAGTPVLKGTKWIATRWIRQGPY